MRRIHSAYRALAAGLALGASFLAWPLAPDPMPIHWDIHGAADGYAPKALGLLLLPIFTFVLPGLSSWVSRRDPLSAGTRRALEITLSASATLLVSLHALVIHAALSPTHALQMALVPPLLSSLALVIGWVLPDTAPNRWIGVRTKATMAHEGTWKVVHRFAGRAMLAAGVAGLAASLLAPAQVAFAISVSAMVLAGVAPMVLAFALGRTRRG